MRSFLVFLIHLYKWFISPLLGRHCRFYPSCSQYAVEAIQVHGCVRGLWLAARRLVRCHPLNPGGFDPVPPPARARKPRAHGTHAAHSGH